MSEEDEDFSSAPEPLREAYKAQKAKNAEMEKQLAELLDKNRATDLEKAFSAKNVDPRVAKFYPKDADSSADKVDAWLAENAELFGIDLGSDDKNAELTNELGRMQQVTNAPAGGAPVGDQTAPLPGSPEEQLRLIMDPSKSFEDLVKAGILQPSK